MPISPDEAETKQMAKEQYDFEFCCKQIDEMLADGGRTYSCDELSGFLADMLIRAYENVGWTVDRVTDQRDGDYLNFSRKG